MTPAKVAQRIKDLVEVRMLPHTYSLRFMEDVVKNAYYVRLSARGYNVTRTFSASELIDLNPPALPYFIFCLVDEMTSELLAAT